MQSVPNVMLIPLRDMPEQLGGAEKIVVAGLLDIMGDLSASFMVVLEI